MMTYSSVSYIRCIPYVLIHLNAPLYASTHKLNPAGRLSQRTSTIPSQRPPNNPVSNGQRRP
jgi:hypothetical protein